MKKVVGWHFSLRSFPPLLSPLIKISPSIIQQFNLAKISVRCGMAVFNFLQSLKRLIYTVVGNFLNLILTLPLSFIIYLQMNRPIQVKQTTDSENRGGKLWPQFFKCALANPLKSLSLIHTQRTIVYVSLLYYIKNIFFTSLSPFSALFTHFSLLFN